MGESGGGHLTASLCVLLAQVMIVVVMSVKMVMSVVLVIFVLCKTVRIFTIISMPSVSCLPR